MKTQELHMNKLDDSLLRSEDVAKRLGISITSFWRLRKEKKFPQPIFIGESKRMIGWRESTVVNWMEDQEGLSNG